ncbi:hypothetical protein, partial [Nocardioides sp.]|uniref:hypothetical protein n=1 Tax=Nocardioides sp. TaxID=35761 RepID=UPI002733E3D2
MTLVQARPMGAVGPEPTPDGPPLPGLREGELLELRRSDVDGVTGRVDVTRKIDKDASPWVRGACPDCGRPISSPKTSSGVRTVQPFLPMLQEHL